MAASEASLAAAVQLDLDPAGDASGAYDDVLRAVAEVGW